MISIKFFRWKEESERNNFIHKIVCDIFYGRKNDANKNSNIYERKGVSYKSKKILRLKTMVETFKKL